MATLKNSLEKFYSIIKQFHLNVKCVSKQETDDFIKHLIHDELDEQERDLVEKNHLYEWLFCHYYTDEEKHILKKFSQLLNGRKTVIYGTGKIACFILNCGFYSMIVGLMAVRKPGTMFCGKPIMSEEQILEAGISQIIVAANVINYQAITERITNFCGQNGILLKGINGRNLIQWYGTKSIRNNIEDRKYYDLSLETLQTEIDRHDVISFDVFDTLVMRKVLYPADIFYIVGQRIGKIGLTTELFVEKRKDAEYCNTYEKNLFGIYHTLQDMLGITDFERDRIMELEIETERQMLVCRKELVESFWYALSKGKRVFLISDMYLPEMIMGELLSNVGIKGYEKILVSCEYHCGKTSGLFHRYKEMTMGGRCLHIGDNEIADGAAFEQEGIDVFLVRSALKMMETSNLRSLKSYIYSMKEQNAVGMLLAKTFNSPFALKNGHGVVQIRTYKEWGFSFLGIYATAYFDWMVRRLKESKIQKMLFSTRDGFLFYDLYQWYRDNIDSSLPEAVYFKTSRKVCYLASLFNEENIVSYLNYDNVYTPQEVLEKRFMLEKNDIMPYTGIDRQEYVLLHKEKIFQKSAIIRERYLSYMTEIGLRENMEYGFFDSYCRGTVQYLMEQFVPFELHGLYMGKIHNTRKLKKVQSFYEDEGRYLRLDDINEKRTLMEYCFSSPETNIIGIDTNGKFMYAEEYRTEKDIRHMLDIQEGIKSFFVQYHSSFPLGEETFCSSLPNAVINTMELADLTDECVDMHTIRSIDDMVNKGYAVWEI